MAVRALIIAVEDYPHADAIASNLPGTLAAARDFRDWLKKKWAKELGPRADTQLLFCSSPRVSGGRGATARDVRKALLDLREAGQNTTDELFLYFSGHGFRYNTPEDRPDILVLQEFETSELSGDSCIPLGNVISWLRRALGPGRHYHFVDACRTDLDSEVVLPGRVLPPFAQTAGEASTFLIQSVQPGQVAEVDGDFAKHLLGGLGGQGIAKAWDDRFAGAMVVRYDSLREHLNAVAKRPVWGETAGREGERAAVLATLRPVPTVKCHVEIKGLAVLLKGRITCRGSRRDTDFSAAVSASSIELSLRPDKYQISLTVKDRDVLPREGVSIDVYDEAIAKFEILPGSRRPATKKPAFASEVGDLDLGDVRLRRFDSDEKSIRRVKKTLKKARAAKKSAATARLAAAKPKRNLAQSSIAAFFPKSQRGTPVFSRTLHKVDDSDLDQWLAICGAGRILDRGAAETSNIRKLPLKTFHMSAGSSSIYVLAAFDTRRLRLGVALSDGKDVKWCAARQPVGMPGLKEFATEIEAGPKLVSFKIDDDAPYTVATCAMPNRVTLLTMTLGDHRIPRISQFILPVGNLMSHLERELQWRLKDRAQLDDIRQLTVWLQAFRSRGDVLKSITNVDLNAILYTKWLDPVTSALACYELIRRGAARRLANSPVIPNLMTYFPDLPDGAAIAAICGRPAGPAPGVPLFLDGVEAMPDKEKSLPLDASRLDYRGPWTMWRGAVNA